LTLRKHFGGQNKAKNEQKARRRLQGRVLIGLPRNFAWEFLIIIHTT